jgi:uncharacterized integral membrane protein
MMRFLGLLFALVVFILGLLFALGNAGTVTLHYIWGSTETPLSYVAFGGCVIGLLLGFIGCRATVLRLRRENRKLRTRVRDPDAPLPSPGKASLKDVR